MPLLPIAREAPDGEQKETEGTEMIHICRSCGHSWKSIDNDTARKVIAAAKVNKQGPFCNLCLHLVMALRFAKARQLKDVSNLIERATRAMTKEMI